MDRATLAMTPEIAAITLSTWHSAKSASSELRCSTRLPAPGLRGLADPWLIRGPIYNAPLRPAELVKAPA
jgi:hypothetical protein